MRRLTAAVGVLAVAIGASACTSTPPESASAPSTTSSVTSATPSTTLPALSGNREAISQMRAALGHGTARSSLHYVSTSLEAGLTTRIVGDVGQFSGAQTIVVSYRGSKAEMEIELVGHEAYFRGAAAAIEVVINLSARESAAAAGEWVSVVPADRSYYSSTAAALTVASVMSEITLSSPVSRARAVTVGGRSALRIGGAWTGDGITAKDHATAELYVTRGARSLPIMFDGAFVSAGNRFTESLVTSKWGETVQVTAPSSSVPLAAILKNTTTTTQPVVV